MKSSLLVSLLGTMDLKAMEMVSFKMKHSETKLAASIRVWGSVQPWPCHTEVSQPQGGNTTFVRNVGACLPFNNVSHLRRPYLNTSHKCSWLNVSAILCLVPQADLCLLVVMFLQNVHRIPLYQRALYPRRQKHARILNAYGANQILASHSVSLTRRALTGPEG